MLLLQETAELYDWDHSASDMNSSSVNLQFLPVQKFVL